MRGSDLRAGLDIAERCFNDLVALAQGLDEAIDREAQAFGFYHPYGAQRSFHAVGRSVRERLLMAGNQVGKTTCGAAELAIHLSGNYPDWWAATNNTAVVKTTC